MAAGFWAARVQWAMRYGSRRPAPLAMLETKNPALAEPVEAGSRRTHAALQPLHRLSLSKPGHEKPNPENRNPRVC